MWVKRWGQPGLIKLKTVGRGGGGYVEEKKCILQMFPMKIHEKTWERWCSVKLQLWIFTILYHSLNHFQHQTHAFEYMNLILTILGVIPPSHSNTVRQPVISRSWVLTPPTNYPTRKTLIRLQKQKWFIFFHIYFIQLTIIYVYIIFCKSDFLTVSKCCSRISLVISHCKDPN